MTTSRFIISLDFELHWGVFDHTALDEKGQRYFRITRELIPPTLALFQQNGIRATWATVGLLFAKHRAEVERVLPAIRPQYQNTALDPYPLIAAMGENEARAPYHYAPSLLAAIMATPGQQVGSHTFSHYYCLEAGQTAASFRADLAAAKQLAQANFGLELKSLVFPRNQFSPLYLEIIAEQGFQTYRSNPDIWFWRAGTTGLLAKANRLLDHYLPLDRQTSFPQPATTGPLVDIPASRFFRPYLPHLDGFGGQGLKLRRICQEMSAAAQSGQDYHLWWHPHNLATDPTRNMAALGEILAHYRQLHRTYGMQSASMEDLAE